MRNSMVGTGHNGLSSSPRRELIKGAALAGLGLLLPASRVLAAVTQSHAKAGATSVAIGYWQQGNIASNNPSDVLFDASVMTSAPGAYELRVLDVETDVSLALDALYPGGVHHRFWQAWKEGSLLQHSHTSTIRWSAGNGSPLQLDVSLSGGSTSTSIAARPGRYVLAVGSAAQPLPAWSDLALRPRVAGSYDEMRLISRASGKMVQFPYALFVVQQAGV